MEHLSTHRPVSVLLMNRQSPAEYESLKRWLSSQHLACYEAKDMSDAIDELCDFTVAGFPEVILIPATSLAGSVAAECSTISRMFGESLTGGAVLPVFVYPDDLEASSRSGQSSDIDTRLRDFFSSH